MTCDRCYQPETVGEHGIGLCPYEKRRTVHYVESVTWPGGKVFENMGHEPVTCYSPADWKRELKARKLEPMVRHVEGDQHVKSWATMDAQTLANARALAERQAYTKATNTPEAPMEWVEAPYISDGGAFGVRV